LLAGNAGQLILFASDLRRRFQKLRLMDANITDLLNRRILTEKAAKTDSCIAQCSPDLTQATT
jgi:hypothetical protein